MMETAVTNVQCKEIIYLTAMFIHIIRNICVKCNKIQNSKWEMHLNNHVIAFFIIKKLNYYKKEMNKLIKTSIRYQHWQLSKHWLVAYLTQLWSVQNKNCVYDH